jgi:hypothetical protein
MRCWNIVHCKLVHLTVEHHSNSIITQGPNKYKPILLELTYILIVLQFLFDNTRLELGPPTCAHILFADC